MTWSFIKQDVRRAAWANQLRAGPRAVLSELRNPGTQAILVYRLARGAYLLRFAPLRMLCKLLLMPFRFYYRTIVGIYIPATAQIGPGFVIHVPGGGIFIGGRVRVGKNLTIVGGGVLTDFEIRSIGDDVRIGAGAKLVNKIRIGDRVWIGPNAVVAEDVPDDCMVMASMPRILKRLRPLTPLGPGDVNPSVARAAKRAAAGRRTPN